MKKLINLVIAALAIVAAACSSSLKAVEKLDGGKLMEQSLAQQMAAEKPGVRAVGEGTSTYAGYAKQYAENDARAQFARGLNASITSAIRDEQYSYGKSKANDKKTTKVDDDEKTQHLMNQTLAKVDVKGLVIVQTDTYKLKNKQYRAYVCVEYRGDVQKLANQIADGYKNVLIEEEYGEDNISQEKREEIDRRAEEFRNSIKEELERLLR